MGGGRLIQKEETTITGGYNKCYCGQVSAAARPFANAIYCQCSRAWLEQYFGSIFERPVSVKMAKTILQGAKSCEFEITLN
jgi:predicted hydrocarbon binding protein